MRFRSNRYFMLVASLPAMPPRLESARLPIGPARLEERLRLLEPEDAREMARMTDVLEWSRQFREATDAAVAERYDELMRAVSNPLVREVLTDLMDVRMLTTALRRRRRGLGPPEVGIGRWFDHIRRNYARPDFRLGRLFPRLSRLAPLLEQGDVLSLHRALMTIAWQRFKRRADDHTFGFEAVVLYVVRWHLIAQWQAMRAEQGRPIFESLVAEALGENAHVDV
ncbi:MAG TPA: DUF2764 family protein [Candidatus Binatia bacterium]|nr:DUF2764 family protein [Candidatus Binatia bacterium]